MIMSQNPKVSVVMAVYNCQRYLTDAIESIRRQTYNDWEFVIIDDCSADNTPAILEQYVEMFPDKIKVYNNNANLGIASSLNKAIGLSNGQYIACMDADDISKPYRFQKQIDFLESNPDIAIVSSAEVYIDEFGKIIGRRFPVTAPNKIRKKILQGKNVIVHPAVMMRKSAFIACGKYNDKLTFGFEDSHLWNKFISRGFQFAILQEPLISYRIHQNAISNRKYTNEQIRLRDEIVKTDDPPMELVDTLRIDIEKSKYNNFAFDCRKSRIVNSLHCKIWRISKKFMIPERIVEKIVCGVRNISY